MADADLPEEIVREIATKQGWRQADTRRRIQRTQEILQLPVEEAISFLREVMPGSRARAINKILIIARVAHMSPKAVLAQDDGGSCRNHASERADEVHQILAELPEADHDEIMEIAETRYHEFEKPLEW